MRRCIVAALLLFALSAFGQERGRVEGTIVDALTQQPIAAVVLQLAGSQTSSDSTGHYAFAGVPPGRHLLLTDKSGYSQLRSDGIPMTVSNGEAVGFNMELQRTGRVTGHIYSTNGAGLQMMLVIPYRVTYDPNGKRTLSRVSSNGPISERENAGTRYLRNTLAGSRSLSHVHAGQTDDLGEFGVTDLDAGSYAFYFLSMTNGPVGPVFYPGAVDAARAEIVSVQSGQETQLRGVTVNVETSGQLRAQLIDRIGQPGLIGFIQVHRTGSTETVLQKRVLVANGNSEPCLSVPTSCTEIGPLPAGSYEVEAVLSDAALTYVASTAAHLEMAGVDVSLDLHVSAGTKVSGMSFTNEPNGPGVPVAGLTLRFRSDTVLPNLTFTLASDAKGMMQLRSVPPGVYALDSAGGVPDGLCLIGLSQGDRNIRLHGFDIRESAGGVEARLAPSQNTIEGIVVDAAGHPVHGADVVLIPNDKEQIDSYVTSATDQHGAFALSCVRPGDYRVFAWRALNGEAFRNDAFMQPYVSQGQAVTAPAIGRLTVKPVLLSEPPAP